MNLSGQFHIPLVLPQVNTNTPQQKVPVPPGVMYSENSNGHAKDYGYPEATFEERSKRSLSSKSTKSPTKTPPTKTPPSKTPPTKTPPSKTPPTKTPPTKVKQKLPGGPNSPGNATHTSQRINKLQSKDAFPSVSGELAKIVRNTIVESTLGGLVNLGFTVAKHVVSDAMEKRIKAQAEMPGAEKKNVDGTKSTVDPFATKQQKVDARLEGAEINVELLANSILSINEGPDALAVGKSPNAPTTTNERLDNLEKQLDAVEGPLEDIAKRYGQLYTRPPASDSSAPSTPQSRLDSIEQRYAQMNKMLKRLVAVKEAEAAEEE